MAVTEITVRGEAYDRRLPDRATVNLMVQREGRDWADVHATVAQAVARVRDLVDRLIAEHAGAVEHHAISQAYQRSWRTKVSTMYAEHVDIAVTFTDFGVMNGWVAAVATETVKVSHIDWRLSREAQDAVRRELGERAVADARARADSFAAAAGVTIIGLAALADPGLLGGDQGAIPAPRAMMMSRGVAFAGGSADAVTDPGYDLTPDYMETTAQVEARYLAE